MGLCSGFITGNWGKISNSCVNYWPSFVWFLLSFFASLLPLIRRSMISRNLGSTLYPSSVIPCCQWVIIIVQKCLWVLHRQHDWLGNITPAPDHDMEGRESHAREICQGNNAGKMKDWVTPLDVNFFWLIVANTGSIGYSDTVYIHLVTVTLFWYPNIPIF